MFQNNTLNISIAGIICQINLESRDYYQIFKENYCCFKANIQDIPDIKLIVKTTDKHTFNFDLNQKKDFGFLYFPDSYLINTKKLLALVPIAVAFFLIKRGIILLHASAFIRNKQAFVFCGPSGVGKSTVINLANDHIPLSDDVTIIRKAKKGYDVYPSPFDKNKCREISFTKARLAKIFLLNKGNTDKIKNLSFFNKIKFLMKENLLRYSGFSHYKSNLYDFNLGLIQHITIRKLYFTKSRRFLDLI